MHGKELMARRKRREGEAEGEGEGEVEGENERGCIFFTERECRKSK